MRDNTFNTESALEKLSSAAPADQPLESDDRSPGRSTRSAEDVDGELEELLEYVADALPVDEMAFDDALVKETLDELLLMLITLHEETHGDELLTDLERLFDAQLSPGTVYPRLHELEDRDVLSMHAKVRTKEYSIDDPDYVRDTIEGTMIQHLAFGMLLYAFLDRY